MVGDFPWVNDDRIPPRIQDAKVDEQWECDIHGTTFMADENTCPDCQSEWHPVENDEKEDDNG